MNTVQLESEQGGWVAEPLGESRLLPRTRFEAGTVIGVWSVDLRTGLATKLLRLPDDNH